MKKESFQLDEEERQIMEEIERGEWVRDPDFVREKRALLRAAANTLRKDKRINIRISSRDLMQLRKRALREGIPYQTLISSTLHKFVSGQLKEVG